MKADGTIWIDTKIDESGMEDGFNRMRDGADDVAVSFRNAGKVIEKSFSNINFNKTIENLKAQIRGMEAEFESVSRELEDAVKFDDDKAAEKLGAKRAKIYDRIARLREKLAVEVAAAASKEATAEEKASRRVVAAEEKEAAKRKQLNNDLVNAGNSASYFGNRLRGIVSSALVFNVISSGLRSVTSYFGQALMANNQFATAVYRLKGSLMVAFQPIYESVLPALITLINWLNVAVQAVARFFSILAGKSYSQMQSNAESLGSAMGNIGSSSSNAGDSVENMGDAIQDTGKQAKEAEKYLAGFDEINRMIAEDAENLSDSLGNMDEIGGGNIGTGDLGLGDFKGPIFEEVELPKEWETAIDKLAMRFKDIFFEWENLTPENIAEKLLTALTTVAGGLIGFALGGPGGAVIGMIVGAGLGVVLSSLIFDGDGKLSPEELIKSLVLALGIIGGGIIGFVVGGSVGAAAIGIVVGAGLSLVIASLIFDEEGNISADGITEALIITLGAVAGGIIGFQIGGPGGALIGIVVGAGIEFVLSGMAFNNDGTLTYEELEKGLLNVILPLGGAGIGFAVGGGPVGAIIGFVIGSFLSFVLTKADITAEEGAISGTEILEGIKEIFTAVAITGFSMILGGIAGNGPGAAMGAIIGLVASFRLLGIEFGEIQLGFDGLKKKIAEWSKQTTQTVDDNFTKPTSANMKNLQRDMTTSAEQTKNSIQQNMEKAATATNTNFFEPTSKASVKLTNQMATDSNKTSESWNKAASNIEQQFINRVGDKTDVLSNRMTSAFHRADNKIKDIFGSLRQWFSEKVLDPIWKAFDDVVDKVIDGLNRMAREISNLLTSANRRVTTTTTYKTTTVAAGTMYAATPEIPMLARGAVIPPNQKFLAVLGDQRHGTNIEAPLETIQEAVALVMDDMVQSNLVGFEGVISVLQEILEAVMGIEIGDQVIADAVQRYQRKMAVVRGG